MHSLHLGFFTGSKQAWDWMSNGSLQSHAFVRGIHIQLKPLKLIPVIDAWLDKVVHQEIVFKRRLCSTHLKCKNMIYLLTLFWNKFPVGIFFLVIRQIANCRSYWVTITGDVDSHGTSSSYNLSTRINVSHVLIYIKSALKQEFFLGTGQKV